MAHLTLTGSGTDRKIDLPTDTPLVIGRDNGATLQIDDKRASRLHARVVAKDDDFVVEDLESTNGTLVNEKRVTSHVLVNGDVVRIGEVRLKFGGGRDAPPAAKKAAKKKKLTGPKIDLGGPPPKEIKVKLESQRSRRGSSGDRSSGRG